MSRLHISLLLCLIAAALGFALAPASTGPRAPDQAGTVRDFLGRAVPVFAVKAERVISLSPSNTEILFALGAGDRVIAVTEYSDYPEAAKEKPRVGGFQSPDVEQIVALRPDVVFAAGQLHTRVIQQLTAAQIPVVAIEPRTMQDVLAAIELVGAVIQEPEAARGLTGKLKGRLDRIHRLTAGQAAARVFVEVWDEPFMTIGGKSYLSDIVAQAGGINVAKDKPLDYMTCDFETLYGFNPDVYVAVSHVGLGRTLGMSKHPWMQNLPAVAQEKVYYVPDDILSRPGPRSFDGLVELAKILHPEMTKSWSGE